MFSRFFNSTYAMRWPVFGSTTKRTAPTPPKSAKTRRTWKCRKWRKCLKTQEVSSLTFWPYLQHLGKVSRIFDPLLLYHVASKCESWEKNNPNLLLTPAPREALHHDARWRRWRVGGLNQRLISTYAIHREIKVPSCRGLTTEGAGVGQCFLLQISKVTWIECVIDRLRT